MTHVNTMSQTQIIIDYLNTGRTITAVKALEIAGTMRLAARISDIVKKGYPAVREWVTTPTNKRVMSYRFSQEYLDGLKKPFKERIKTFFDDLLKGGMFDTKKE